MAEETTAKKDTKTWHEGYPTMPGYYLCKIDGDEEEMYLKYYHCDMRMKDVWLDPVSKLYVEEKIFYSEGPYTCLPAGGK